MFTRPTNIARMNLLVRWLVTIACAAAWSVRGAEWAQFRGPGGSGVGEGTFPTQFGLDTNLVWKAAVPSGHSSPCISNGSIFLTGFAEGKLWTLCFDAAEGRLKWKRDVQAGPIERGAHLSNAATATPASDGQSVFVYFGSFGLICYDFHGKERWRLALPVPVTQHGAGTSPVIAAGRLILACDQDTDSFLLCVDAASGSIIWKQPRPGFKRGFSTPLLFPPDAPEQIILPGSLRLVSYHFSNGTERWSVNGFPNEMVASPVAAGGLVYAAGWTPGSGVRSMPSFDQLLSHDTNQDGKLARSEIPSGPAKQHFLYLDANKDGLLTRDEYESTAALFDRSQNVAMAIRPDGTGDVTASHLVWKQTRGLPYCPTPLIYRDRFYMIKNGGLFTCLEARTGKVVFQEERIGALGDYYASPVAAEGKICVVSQNGMAVVLKAGDTLEVLARNDIGEPVIATPAIGHNRIWVRGAEHLFAFGEPSGGAASK